MKERFKKVGPNHVQVDEEIVVRDIAGANRTVLRKFASYGQTRVDRDRVKWDKVLTDAQALSGPQFKAEIIKRHRDEAAKISAVLNELEKINVTDADGNEFEAFDPDAADDLEPAGFSQERLDRANADREKAEGERPNDRKQALIDNAQAKLDRLDVIQQALDS